MSILFYNMKGGQGKTTHAVGYASYAGVPLVTNDFENGTAEIYRALLPAEQIAILKPGQKLEGFADKNVVFDFG
jgi:hypothetical protein